MLVAFKQLLYAILSPLAVPMTYFLGFVTLLTGVFKRAEVTFFALIVLTPLPNIWYKFHPYPLGKDTLDLLIFATTLGVFVNKKGFESTRNAAYLVIFIVMNYLAVWHSSMRFSLPLPVTTENQILLDWKNYAEMIFLYFLAANAVREEREQQTLIVILAMVILFINVREFRNFSEGSAFSYDKRAQGPFWIVGLGANHLGAFITHYCGFLFGLFLVDENRKRKMLYLASALFGLHPLFFSYSRGAYLGALAVVAFYGLVKKRSLLALIAALVLAWQTLLPATVVERISMTETQSGEIEESAAHRLFLWNHAMGLFENNPLFGVGYGGFGFTVPEGEKLTDTHNFYMKMLSEQGLVGITLFALVLLKAFGSGWSLYRSRHSPFYSGLGLGLMGCVVGCVVTNMFGDRWSYFVLGSYFFILWGVVDRSLLIVQEARAGVHEERARESMTTVNAAAH